MRVGLFLVVFKNPVCNRKLVQTITFCPAQTYFNIGHSSNESLKSGQILTCESPGLPTTPLYSLYQEKWLLSVAKSEITESLECVLLNF